MLIGGGGQVLVFSKPGHSFIMILFIYLIYEVASNRHECSLWNEVNFRCFGHVLPVHRDAGEEEDGAVQVEVKEEAYEAAHEVTEHPVVPQHVAGHQEGQRQAVHQVGGGQVHHVDQGGVPVPPAAVTPAWSQQHHRVERQAEEEGQRVADRQEDVLVGLVDAARRRGQEGGGRAAGAIGSGAHQEVGIWWCAEGSTQTHDDPRRATYGGRVWVWVWVQVCLASWQHLHELWLP